MGSPNRLFDEPPGAKWSSRRDLQVCSRARHWKGHQQFKNEETDDRQDHYQEPTTYNKLDGLEMAYKQFTATL